MESSLRFCCRRMPLSSVRLRSRSLVGVTWQAGEEGSREEPEHTLSVCAPAGASLTVPARQQQRRRYAAAV